MQHSSLPLSLPVGRSAARPVVQAILTTPSEAAPAIARVVLGLVILPHGAQKTVGWFGGYGFAGTMQWFTETMHFPPPLGFAAILTETVGALALLIGFGSRFAAFAVGVVFASAALTVHWQHGFFANWFGNQKGEGIEYFVLGLALASIVVLRGGGTWSVDRALSIRPSGGIG